MLSNVTVLVPADTYDLTVLDTVKAELGLTDTTYDVLLTDLIHQASNVISSWCDRVFALETVSEDFWQADCWGSTNQPLQLSRRPVESITSVTLDGDAVASGNYRLNKPAGLLYRLNDSGVIDTWSVSTLLTVVYDGGFVLLTDLPYDIERACLDLVKGSYFTRSRDPQVKSENIYDVASFSYFGGGESSTSVAGLPANLKTMLAPYRTLAV